MRESPHIVVVRRDHDFRIVQTSRDYPYAGPVREEVRWLALDWWGNCYFPQFRGALGHFRSTVEPGLFHLMLVLPGSVAPDRFVISLRDEEYAPMLYSPFRTLREDFGPLTRQFYDGRKETNLDNGWTDSFDSMLAAPPTEEEQRLLRIAELHLTRGRSVVVPTQNDSASAPAEIARCAGQLPSQTRRSISICTFTNAGRDNLLHFGPTFCAQYSTTVNRNLAETLDEMILSEEGKSPFTPIRRRNN